MAPPNVPAARRTDRLSVDALTPQEKDDLSAQGHDLSGEFVDLDLSARKQQLVDPLAARRKDLAAELESPARVVAVQAAAAPAEQQPDRVAQLEAELAELKKRPDVCLRCGWPAGQEVVVAPTDAQRAEFLRCVCAGESFLETYELFGGNVKVTFRTKTLAEVESIGQQIRKMSELNLIPSTRDLFFQTESLGFLWSLDVIELPAGKRAVTPVNPDEENWHAKLKGRLASLPEMLVFAMREKYKLFDQLVGHLTANADDPNFWRGMNA